MMVRFILLTVFAALLSAQSKYSPLFAAMGTPTYPGETYTARGSGLANRVYFDHEPIQFRITIANLTTSNQSLKVVPDAEGNIFHLSLKRGESDVAAGTARPVLSAGAHLRVDQSTVAVDINSQISLAPTERIQWTVEVPDSLPLGEYSVTAGLRGTDGDGRDLPWQVHTVHFEVRASRVAPAEVAYREALRNLQNEDSAERGRAEAAVARLLRLHPQSYAAHSLLGRIEEQRGRPLEAERHYERASELLEKNADSLLLKFNTPEQIEHLKAAMKARRDR